MSVKGTKVATTDFGFANAMRAGSSSSIGFSTKKETLVFPRGHIVNGVVITPTSVSSNYPTIMEGFTGIQGFLKLTPGEILGKFHKMVNENEDLAIRFALWARDARQGAGLRDPARLMFASLSDHPNIEGIINRIPVLGRFDDLLIEWKSERAMRFALARYIAAFDNPDEKGLAAKWAPRKTSVWAYRLRKELGLSYSDYRKFLVANSKTVEQNMCDGAWNSIDYNQVPSVAHKNYRKAFIRHTPDRYERYVGALKAGVRGVKINAGAVEPHELASKVMMGQQLYSDSLDAQFNAIPFSLEGLNIFPVVDVSPSMQSISTGTQTCKSVAMSLGLWIAQNQTKTKGLVMTFSQTPRIVDYSSKGFSSAILDLQNQDWGRYTDLTASMKLMFSRCKAAGVTEDELPDVMVVLSD